MSELLAIINSNQGVIQLVLLLMIVEIRVHMRDVFRRLEKLEGE